MHRWNPGCPPRDGAARAAWAGGSGLCSSSGPSPGTFPSAPRPRCIPQGHPCLQSTRGCAPQLAWKLEQGGIPLARKQPQGWGWMRHSGLGYPACCLSQHGAAACPGLTVAPGSLALPRAHPTIPIACPYGSWGCSSQQLRGCWGDINIIPALSGTPL